MEGVHPVNDMIERRILSPTAGPLALDEVPQKILYRTAEIAREKSGLPDEIAVQAHIDRTFRRIPVVFHGTPYAHAMRMLLRSNSAYRKAFRSFVQTDRCHAATCRCPGEPPGHERDPLD